MTAAYIFLFGLCLGSFLNVCIQRLPKGESVVRPRSRCPRCGQAIAAYDNIPLVSYALLGGRCRRCRAHISPVYPLVEALTGAALVLAYWRFGLTPAGLKAALLAAAMIVLFFTDLRERLLPDAITRPATLAGVGFALWFPVGDGSAARVAQLLSVELSSWSESLADGLLGAIAGAGLLLAVRQAYYWWRHHEGMGLGDVKMMGMVGTFLGLKLTILTILLGSLAGSLASIPIALGWLLRAAVDKRFSTVQRRLTIKRNKPFSIFRLVIVKTGRAPVPFGVFLAVAALVAVFWGRALVGAYLGLFP